MKIIFSIDRIEGEVAVCISDDDRTFHVPTDSLCGMGVRDVFSARVEGESLLDVTPEPEERDRRIKANRERLHALARRSKNGGK